MNVDVVIIGVNSEKTISKCIESAKLSRYHEGLIHLYYVDGGSSDDSVSIAREAGAQVIELTLQYPTPGAGRNAGWKVGHSKWVQFMDADTILHPDWLGVAVSVVSGEGVGAVCGDRKEAHPEKTFYNWVASLEWNTSEGICEAFGGDVMIRREALEETGGYDEVLVGGEDPEFSQRIRLSDWRIVKIDEPMTLHDIAMEKVSQYWKRAYRTGYGYAAVTYRHGFRKGSFWTYELKRILVRGGLGLSSLLMSCISGFCNYTCAGLMLAIAVLLIFYPRFFSVQKFRKTLNLSVRRARRYAWHCSIVVIPQFLGLCRYYLGMILHVPLHNKETSRSSLAVFSIMTSLIFVALFSGGVFEASAKVRDRNLNTPLFQTANAKDNWFYATMDEVQAFSESVAEEYSIGAGDVFTLIVRGRPDVSLENVIVAPDGTISLPRMGVLDARGLSISDLTEVVLQGMSRYYESPDITIHMVEYNNNKVFVLGRVENPGLIHFKGNGTLLEAISMAGGLPTVAEDAFLTRAVIFRGDEAVIWVDLRELLNKGQMILNPRLRNNDIVYIPESDDELVYVMGDVANPGAVRLKSELTVIDAIMFSGGPRMSTKLTHIYLIRQVDGVGHIKQIDFKQIIKKGDLSKDYLLIDGDLIYVSPKRLEEINYVIKSITPSLTWLPLK